MTLQGALVLLVMLIGYAAMVRLVKRWKRTKPDWMSACGMVFQGIVIVWWAIMAVAVAFGS